MHSFYRVAPRRFRFGLFLLLFCAVSAACDSTEPESAAVDDSSAVTDDGSLPAVFGRFVDGVEVYRDGDEVVVVTDGVPNHPSPYFSESDARYEVYDGDNAAFRINPNRIQEQQFTFRLPVNPRVADVHAATPLGPVGVAVNGVAIFNQYAGPNRPLSSEIDSFDQYNGHPQQTGVYHYHVEPLYLTETDGEDALIGFLLDGFPVYGPEENGRTITNADLDEYHGHVSATPDFPEGIYHYHVTAEDPYINGSGFFGTPGTVSR